MPQDEPVRTQLFVVTLEFMTVAGHETIQEWLAPIGDGQFFHKSGILIRAGSTNDADATD